MSVTKAVRRASAGLFHALAELGSARLSPPRDPRAAAHRLAGALGVIANAHDLTVTVRGEVPRGAALIVANHVSYLDPLAILPNCPAVPVAKGEVEGWPIVGPIGEALGVIFVKRGDRFDRVRVLRRIDALLAAGVPVLNFPEGTTTHGDRVEPFWRGGFGVAQRRGVRVVPVAIRYADPALAWCGDATFIPHYARTLARSKIEVELVFGEPMMPRTGEVPEAMAERARNVIARMLEGGHDAGSRTDVSPPRPDPILPATFDRGDGQRRRRARRRAA
ncbi:MAG: lysophospholipid acyltransferase family protein [Kofleriaceae bacterium]